MKRLPKCLFLEFLLYNSENPEVVENGIAAMNEFVKRLSQASMLELIPTLKKAVTDLQRNAKNKNTVPGLTDPKVGLKVDKHTVNSRFSDTPREGSLIEFDCIYTFVMRIPAWSYWWEISRKGSLNRVRGRVSLN